MNRCTTSNVHDITPHEKYYGRKLDLSHLKIFGTIAFMHIPDEKRQKLDPKSEKCIRVGYSLEQKGYKYFNSSIRKVHVSCDVFDESKSWCVPDSTPSEPIEEEVDINSEDNIQPSPIPGEV